MNDFIEERVREHPEQYFWLHNASKPVPKAKTAFIDYIKLQFKYAKSGEIFLSPLFHFNRIKPKLMFEFKQSNNILL